MFGLKRLVQKQAASYLQVIRPWAVGKDNRGWVREDFETPVSTNLGDEGYPDWTPIQEVKEYRTDPSHVIFPLLPYDITVLDRLFMSPRLLDAMRHLNQTISNFNAMRDVFTNAQSVDARWSTVFMLHVGLIGTTGGAGLFERFRLAVEAL